MINAWLIDNFGQRLMSFQKISSHCHCHSVTTLWQEFQGHNIKVSWCCSVIIMESLFLFAWKNGHQCQRQNCLNVAKILLIIFQTNYSVLFFLKKKKWAKDIIILEEFALCTKFHEFDDERETFMNCTFVRVLKIMILFLPKLDLFS